MTLTQDRRTELLGGCPLFGGVSAGDLAAIGERAIEVDFPTDHVIARQGEIGTGLFVIIEGAVRVVRDGEELARLGSGDFFGEMSVKTKATVPVGRRVINAIGSDPLRSVSRGLGLRPQPSGQTAQKNYVVTMQRAVLHADKELTGRWIITAIKDASGSPATPRS